MVKVRISFCKNIGKMKEISSTIVEPEFNEIIKIAKNKLKLKINESKIRLFVAKTTFTSTIGQELTIDNTPSIVINDTIICVSEGEDFMLSKEIKNANCTLICPFNFILKKSQLNLPLNISNAQNTRNTTIEQLESLNNSQQYDMHGDFPILDGDVLKHFKDIVKNNNTFVQIDCGDYYAFDYNSATSCDFPNPSTFKNKKEKWIASVKREMRGIIICAHTGKVLARRFHKFFNINECDETNINKIQLAHDFILTEKIDGSLVSPFLINSKLVFATRSQIRHDIENPNKDFIEYCIESNKSPLFELCENDHLVGVIDHTVKSLTLLAIRDNITGEYMNYDNMILLASKYNIKYAKRILINGSLYDIVNDIYNRNLIEGCVLANGQQMYKIKTNWYSSIAYSLKQGGNNNTCFLLELIKCRPIISDIPIYKIYQTILNENSDDYLSHCCTLLPQNERDFLMKTKMDFLDNINKLHTEITTWIDDMTAQYSKDIITQSMINANFTYQFIYACIHNNLDSKTIFINNIKDLCSPIHYKNLQDILLLNDKNIIHVYCDLDGVLVDFEKGVKELTGKFPQEYPNVGYMWANIEKVDNFWTKLEWTEDGKELWDFIIANNNRIHVEILTGLPDGKFKDISNRDKKIWCKNNLGDTKINTCMGREKYTYCQKNFILIDDREEYGVNWQKKGGVFIHHTNTKDTIEQMENILQGKAIVAKQKIYDGIFKNNFELLTQKPANETIYKILNGECIQNLIIIMRGISGCGKTTFTNLLYKSQKEGNVSICSADHYFTIIGKYNKDLTNIAHDYCKDEFNTAIKLKTNIIIIDNTNIMKKHFEYYINTAKNLNKDIIIIELNTYEIADEFNLRNVHNVSLSKIKLMKRNFEMIDNDNVMRILTK
ncbi:putative tRNA ligase/uridine kinase [Bodo saltans virus]|uniref:tRNA ligase/uridine kinase n=1 Tax=Bodo saltans virus TaxID=2024608 RepID=A0A2H4UTQ7_9VIRU|nr:putative tRNA ligase/uridine kinase [Bodo saltans virus]ATZ80229.1 putative tRNA ligase/uridine kinase [Bodo saltans virus]